MQKSNLNLVDSRVPGTWGSLLVLIGFVLIGMAIGNVLALIILAIYLSADFGSVATILNQLITEPEQVKNGWYAMMMLQGTVHFFSYLFPSILYWYFIERKTLKDFVFKTKPDPKIWLLAFVLVLAFIPLNSKFIEWNAAMSFPDALSGLEIWMKEKEEQLAVLTKFLTTYDRFSQLLIALFVVVLLPAWGEETLFRGIIQRKLGQQWGNVHIAIWVSAAIFSAIHFQFYGFLPRMLLGAVFGYLYYWTGSLWIAVFAHFINNGFVLVMVYLYNIRVLNLNIEETKTMPWLSVISSLVLTAVILFTIRKDSLGQKILVKKS
ncbi:CPBP family intramembrane glutamic endopeptidase [Dyadobacter psychrotolerans]|uniref:CPBP family intramembrane metalloprotease n=1 Tax=Dyadobacter psychrotolerans TaxID=2541721 RepID=A0A4R5DRA9_9BACT|nr:CPBP family intramembrane glutamic endopeptidase [Dyadobacter psychrotolerans]TDE13333.1 CPBP family intramembrane metalloprotease [Dyadobacter psychrotolerans]